MSKVTVTETPLSNPKLGITHLAVRVGNISSRSESTMIQAILSEILTTSVGGVWSEKEHAAYYFFFIPN